MTSFAFKKIKALACHIMALIICLLIIFLMSIGSVLIFAVQAYNRTVSLEKNANLFRLLKIVAPFRYFFTRFLEQQQQ